MLTPEVIAALPEELLPLYEAALEAKRRGVWVSCTLDNTQSIMALLQAIAVERAAVEMLADHSKWPCWPDLPETRIKYARAEARKRLGLEPEQAPDAGQD